MNKHALFSISVFPLLCGVFAGGTLNQSKAILEDSIHHEIVHVLEHGLDIIETGDPATLTFSNPNTTSISKNKLLAISLVSKKNLSPYSSDSYIYLQFSFMGINGSDDEKKLYFDLDDPSISERVVNNSLYYQTSDSSYEVPNRCFGETNYFFLVRNGFDGVFYIQLSDYFSSNFTFSKFEVFSDGRNHWNSYELTEVYLCDDINNTNKSALLNLDSNNYDLEYRITDPDITYSKQIVKRNTSLLYKVVDAHVIQSRVTMLNASSELVSGSSDVLVNVQSGYPIRDALIVNLNNLSSSNLLFQAFLIDSDNNEIALKTGLGNSYPLAKSDQQVINLTCDGENVVMPANITNSTLLLKYTDFAAKPERINGLKFLFKNSFECEIGKIIDVKNTQTGDFKTLVEPIKLKDNGGVNVANPRAGTVIKTTTDGLNFKFNNASLYKINEMFNSSEGNVSHMVSGDYVVFTLSHKPGFVLNKVFVNGVQTLAENMSFSVPYIEDLDVYVTFKEMNANIVVDDSSKAVVFYEKYGDDIMFTMSFATGYTYDYAKLNGYNVVLNSNNTLLVSGELNKYDLEIAVRPITISISYIDELTNRHGTCTSEIKNGKVYISFNPEEGYLLNGFYLNSKKIDFDGRIYSLAATKDVFVEVKFIKAN